MSEPRVLLLTSSFPQNSVDPTADFVRRYVEAVDLPGTVLTPEGAGVAQRWALGRMTVEYVPYWLPRSSQRVVHGWGIVENLRSHPWARLQIPALLATWTRAACRAGPLHDVIVAHWALPTGPVGVVAAQASGRPLVSVLHSGGVHALATLPGGRLIARSIFRTSRAIVASSSFVRDRFVALLERGHAAQAHASVEVLPMGFSKAASDVPQTNDRGSKAGFNVLFLGRINRIKGLDTLIDACAGIPECILDVAGYGPLFDIAQSQAEAKGVRATFHGQVSDEQKWQLLDEADVLVVPSRILPDGTTEGLPVVLLEAMGRGTPVVATSVGGVTDLVLDGVNGLLVPPDDAAQLRNAMGRVLRDPGGAKERARVGRAAAVGYEWSKLGPRHQRVIKEAAS